MSEELPLKVHGQMQDPVDKKCWCGVYKPMCVLAFNP